MDSKVKIQFTPQKNDYVHASRTLAGKSKGFLVLAAIVVLIMLAAAVLLIFPTIGDDALNNIALIVLLFGGFYVVYYLVFIPFQLSSAYKKNEYLQKDREFTITESQILMRIGDRSVELDWDGVQKLIDGRRLYLINYKGEERVYPFVPKRAFEDQTTEDAFVQLFKEKSIPVG